MPDSAMMRQAAAEGTERVCEHLRDVPECYGAPHRHSTAPKPELPSRTYIRLTAPTV